MPIAFPEILSLRSEGTELSWTERDVMLYALGLGYGSDPLDAGELPFVYENGLRVMPTMAAALALTAGGLIFQAGINYLLVVHGEQRLTVHRPLPSEARIQADARIVGAYDKGPGKGAIILTETVLRPAEAGAEPYCTLLSSTFARGDGGFGGPAEGAPAPHAVPADRAPDAVVDLPVRPEAALIYRLSGDRNPLHADPAIAAAAGYPRPILHGLCTYGMCARAVLRAFGDNDPTRLKAHDARFSAPVFPGETLSVAMWRDGGTVSFEARVAERGVVVARNGRTVLA
jgi:acyl dehydratase